MEGGVEKGGEWEMRGFACVSRMTSGIKNAVKEE